MRIAEPVEERLDPFEPEPPDARGARVEEIERVAVGSQLEAHPVAAGLPLMCRSSWPTVCLSFERCTTLSTMP